MTEVEKKALSFEEIEAQTMLELPDRELLLTQVNRLAQGPALANVAVQANVGCINIAGQQRC